MAIDRPGTAGQHREQASLPQMLRGSLFEGVVLVDSAQNIAVLTPGAARILGVRTGAGGKAPLESLPRALVRITTEVAVSQKAPHREQLHLPVDDSTRRVDVTAVALGPKSALAPVMLVLNEESPLNHFEQQVERLNRLASLGTLAASMAHEIKNALVAGKTFIDLLLENQQQSELAEVVRRELGRIDTLLSRMLRFARPGECKFCRVHVHEILEHSLRLVEPLMEAKAIAQGKSLAAESDLIEGDEHELQQAFVNLLLNAVDAVGPNSRISVSTVLGHASETTPDSGDERGPAEIQVTIQDTGIGIAPENMQRLFEPFFTTKPSGTGLGLAITRRILQQHRGEISAQSRPGEGTSFIVRLPLASDGGH